MADHDVDTLITAYLEGSLTPEQAERLSGWLTADPANARYVAQLGLIERGLNQHFLSQESADLFAELAEMEAHAEVAAPVDITERLKLERLARKRAEAERLRRLRPGVTKADTANPLVIPVWAVLGTIAAMVLLAVIVLMPRTSPAPTTPPGALRDGPGVSSPTVWAYAVDDFQARWDSRLAPGFDGFIAGRYRLTEGQARLRLADGTVVKLVAPAEFALGGLGEIDLYAGQLVADVPSNATGFRVYTPAGEVVDLGTVFGVEVLDGGATTEAEVLDGLIRVAAKTADGGLTGFVDVTQARAARLDKAAGRVEPIQAGGDRFSMDYVRVIDLIDAVAGGDGTTGRRNAGIDPQTGDWQDTPLHGQTDWTRYGDQRFHPVDHCPLVAGTFIPSGGGRAVRLDPAGNTFNGFTVSDETAYGQTWAGGYVPVPGEQPELDTVIDGVNYAAPSRGLVRMHANSGLCFDLAEVRRRNPGLTTTRFRTALSNREATRREPGDPTNVGLYASVDVWVFVDGRLRFSRRDVTTADGLLNIEISLENEDQYLTIVMTDGLNGTTYDWVLLCQPRIDLRPSDRP